jgi:hypothetical protein
VHLVHHQSAPRRQRLGERQEHILLVAHRAHMPLLDYTAAVLIPTALLLVEYVHSTRHMCCQTPYACYATQCAIRKHVRSAWLYVRAVASA